MSKTTKYSASLILAGLFCFLMVPDAYSRIYENLETPKPYIIKGIVTVQFEDDLDLSSMKRNFGRVSPGYAGLDRTFEELQISGFRKIFPMEKEKPPVNSGLKDLTRYYEISFPDTISVEKIVNRLLQDPNIRWAEPVLAIPVDRVPDDPSWTSQWHRTKLQLADAWDKETGSDSIKIAIIDTGVNYRHPDLTANIWVNPGEDIDGDGEVYDLDDFDGLDNDSNGVVDDLIGYDFLTGIGSVWPGEDAGTPDSDPNDFDGHGTHCSGIAAAVTNNATDVVGIAGGWSGYRSFGGARIMCLRVGATASDGRGYVNSNDCATAINYAANNGAHVINCSWGSSSVQNSALQNAIIGHSVTVCHAAGNDNITTPGPMDNFYEVLSVAATTSSDLKASYSNYGSWIDVSAPGSSILSTYSYSYTPGTNTIGGTSMASPMVAGLAALIRSAMPSLSVEEVNAIIRNNTDDIYALNPAYYGLLGTGRINANKALSVLAIAMFSSDITEGDIPLEVNFTDLSPNSPTSWEWSFGDGAISAIQNPSHIYTEPGIYNVSLKVNDPNGLGEERLRHYIWARADTMIIDSVMVNRGQQAVVPIYLNNTAQIKNMTISITLPNSQGIKLDSASMQGTRTEYFHTREYPGFDFANKRYAVYLGSSPQNYSNYLMPDTGTFLKLYITVPGTAAPGTLVTIDTLSWGTYKYPVLNTIYGPYWPVFKTGKVYVRPCVRGDVDCNGEEPSITDITALISHLYIEPIGEPPIDAYGGDVNADGLYDISDITFLISYLYLGGAEPPAK
ncbi:MAG: S8 family serine peptidase [candidate division Zixibacteria bacterium]|nr:S8 family serine peptidase [candidate division Zixibacteria bacterium]MDD5425231.1 S8 family serine peptidase [candidate division Zixibacteria bacterium]